MINQDRFIHRFKELVAIPNSSKEEAAMCDYLKKALTALSIPFEEDDAASKINGNCGNLYAYVEGEKALPPILLSAHMDSVEPAKKKNCVFHPDGTITSDGTTVLGADDLAGICAILEAITSIKEDGMAHRPVEIVFDVSEETYCEGIQQFDFSRLKSKEAYVFDLTGPIGGAAYQAPAILSFEAVFHGRAAHAAFSPENGIHAIKAAAHAIDEISCGRIGDTTVNVGTIQGGSATNVVPETCIITGEVRSFHNESALRKLDEIKETCEEAALLAGASIDFKTETLCLAYLVDPSSQAVSRFTKACDSLHLEPKLISTYGGSDNNHFFHHGITGLVVACGMNDCHSCKEYTSVPDLMKAARLAEALILSEI